MLNITKSALNDNTTQGKGGAIDNVGSISDNDEQSLIISDSTLNGNSARHGGAIYNGGKLNVTCSSFSNNIANDVGGAMLNMGVLSISDSKLTDNNANYGGGAIFNKSKKYDLDNCIFKDNQPDDFDDFNK